MNCSGIRGFSFSHPWVLHRYSGIHGRARRGCGRPIVLEVVASALNSLRMSLSVSVLDVLINIAKY